MAHMSKEKEFKRTKDINDLHGWGKEITQATGKAMGVKLTETLRGCKVCALGKAKKAGVRKLAFF